MSTSKIVEYEDEKYNIKFISYGFTKCRFVVNDEPSSSIMLNEDMNNISAVKEGALAAIKEYITAKEAESEFNEWDGKL